MLNKTKSAANRRRIILIFAVALIAIIAAVALLQTKKQPLSTGDKIQVVAAENFWGNIMAQIGGEHVAVTSIISEPGTDPHLYESGARDASRLAEADIVIANGLGYDDFMIKLLSASKSDSRQVINVADVLKADASTNPHLWYDVPRIATVAAAFEGTLAAKDPSNAKAYAANLAAFNRSLRPALTALQQIRTLQPGAPVAYTERVPEYLLAAAGLRVKTPAGFSSAIEEGNDPSPAATAEFEKLITQGKIKALIYNAQATSSVTEHIRELAEQNHVPVVGMTETMPKDASSYQAWQLDQAKALLKALESK
jgi:zinc/manganese transport system substrate-binding protein